jgi:hypothetical protein
MGFWQIYWIINIVFAVVSFTILSIYVLVKGFAEVKDMLTALEDGANNSNNKE